MKTGSTIPWKYQTDGVSDREDAAHLLFRGLARPDPLSPGAWSRIRFSVRERARVGGRAAIYGRFALRFALVALLVMLVPLTAALGWRGVRAVARRWAETRQEPARHVGALHAPRAAQPRAEVLPPPMAIPPAPSPVVAPDAVPVSDVGTSSAVARSSIARPAPRVRDAEGKQLFEESRLVAAALKALRVGRPADALGELSLYRSRYPAGLMKGEASLAEVRAELDLGLDAQALLRLEELARDDFHGVPRPDEARLLRGELLSRRAECGRAVVDFDLLLASPLDSTLEQRALYGRATCRSATGDVAGRADLSRYLSRFPEGRFADSARRLIAGD